MFGPSVLGTLAFTFIALLSITSARAQTAAPTGPNVSAGTATAPAAPKDLDAIADELVQIFAAAMRSEYKRQSAGLANAPVMRRPVFSKAHGCLKADFNIDPNLPADLKVGVFAARSYPAWVRFSNDGALGPDTVPMDQGGNPARGLAIKLVGVPGVKLLPGQEQALTQDFILENHPVFFSANARDFLSFNQDFDGFLKSHPREARILNEMETAQISDPLRAQFWTPTPYRLGPAHAMKYMVKPCEGEAAWQKSFTQMNGDNYLRENLVAHVDRAKAVGELCLDFYVQIQHDPVEMPIDDASQAWDEAKSSFIHAATLTFAPGQNVLDAKRVGLCESLSFNGWHAIAEHEPLGSLNGVRKIVYAKIAEMRKSYNNSHEHRMPKIEPASIGRDD